MEPYPVSNENSTLDDATETKIAPESEGTKGAKKKRTPRKGQLTLVDNEQPDGGFRGQKRMAERFARKFAGRLIYTPGRHWLAYNGSYWEECGSDAAAWRGVQEVCHAAYAELPRLARMDWREALFSDIRRCDSAEGTAGVLKHAQRHAAIQRRDEDLDANPDLFVCQNGTYDLAADIFRPSRPEDLMTLAAGVVYDPNATCALYDHLFSQFQEDQEIRDYLHRLGGAAMEGRQNLQQLIINYGATGGNGKGTIQCAWQHVFGGYTHTLPVEALIARRGYDQYKDEKAKLQGKRLVYLTEPSEGQKFDTGTVKGILGGEPVTSRAVYKSSVTFEPTWLLMMSTNNRVSTPNDGGMARRLKEIPWLFTIDRDKMDPTIAAKLRAEGSGILNRLIEGWKDYKANGIQEPESVKEGTAKYLSEVDTISQFLEECIAPKEGVKVPSSLVYKRYSDWCHDSGEKPKALKNFSPDLEKRGYVKDVTKKGNFWVGIEIVHRSEGAWS